MSDHLKKYPDVFTEKTAARWNSLIGFFQTVASVPPQFVISTPGRTEIAGNHTDHNQGKVLAGAVTLDALAAVAPGKDNAITLVSDAFPEPFVLNADDLRFREEERGTTKALIRGIAASFSEKGYRTGGFTAAMTSDVMVGSGLSSSAAVEVLIGTIFNAMYNENAISPKTIALIGQSAENKYFGKPCGLMDQVACAVGGIVGIDFENRADAVIEKIDFDFSSTGYSLVVVDCGATHADLTPEYSAIPSEMKSVAAFFGKQSGRELSEAEFISEIPALRRSVGDRAVLRILHFLEENSRVDAQAAALKKNDFGRFLALVNESGNSSYRRLQNIYPAGAVKEQPVAAALGFTEHFIRRTGRGACRVHGGGFAGTIQTFIPAEDLQEYIGFIEKIFGSGSAKPLGIRRSGTVSCRLQ